MGQQIDLTAREFGDIVAFTHDPEMQKSLLAAEITNNIKDLIE